MSCFFIAEQIYIDYNDDLVYLIGFIFDDDFLYDESLKIKKMYLRNKSEKAIYITINLRMVIR